MAWEILHTARVLQDTVTGELGVQCGSGGTIVKIGNTWRDVTNDFTWYEQAIPMFYAVIAGNNVLYMTAEMVLTEQVTGEIHLFDTTEWRSIVDSAFPIMVVHDNGTVTMIDGRYMPDGYVAADLTDVTETDKLYFNIVVPCE